MSAVQLMLRKFSNFRRACARRGEISVHGITMVLGSCPRLDRVFKSSHRLRHSPDQNLTGTFGYRDGSRREPPPAMAGQGDRRVGASRSHRERGNYDTLLPGWKPGY